MTDSDWILFVQSVVIALIFEPDTPGGLRANMACRAASSSATTDDMAEMWRPAMIVPAVAGTVKIGAAVAVPVGYSVDDPVRVNLIRILSNGRMFIVELQP